MHLQTPGHQFEAVREIPQRGARLELAAALACCALLLTTLIKNCDPPLSGRPVLAMEMVPGSLEIFAANSSGIQPPVRTMDSPVAMLV